MDSLQINQWNSVASKISFTLEPDLLVFKEQVSLDSKVLDYGCGYGRVTNKFYKAGYKNIVGYDTSPEMIKRGQQNFPDLDLQTYEFPALPCSDNTFDAAICCAVLTCIPNINGRNKILDELGRVLKPSGMLYVCEFARNPDIEYDENGVFKTRFDVEMKHFSKDDFLSLFQNFKQKFLREKPAKSISGIVHSSFHYIGFNE